MKCQACGQVELTSKNRNLLDVIEITEIPPKKNAKPDSITFTAAAAALTLGMMPAKKEYKRRKIVIQVCDACNTRYEQLKKQGEKKQ